MQKHLMSLGHQFLNKYLASSEKQVGQKGEILKKKVTEVLLNIFSVYKWEVTWAYYKFSDDKNNLLPFFFRQKKLL